MILADQQIRRIQVFHSEVVPRQIPRLQARGEFGVGKFRNQSSEETTRQIRIPLYAIRFLKQNSRDGSNLIPAAGDAIGRVDFRDGCFQQIDKPSNNCQRTGRLSQTSW